MFERISKVCCMIVVLQAFAIVAFAQNITVRGTVTNDKGEAVAGASVIIKGGSAGTATDVGGNFSISAANGATLVITAINYLEKINDDPHNFFYGKLKVDKIGILGFSFGGAVSANTLVLDKRIKAGVNLDGFYYGRNYGKGFEQPFMELRSQPASPEKVTDAELKMSHLSRERWKYIWFDEWNRRFSSYTKNVKGSWYSYIVSGADHFSFCDLPLMAPIPWLLSPKTARIHELTNQYTLAFFDQQLKGINSKLLTDHRQLLK